MGVTVFFALQLPSLQTDFEFEKFFPTNDPDIAFYEQHLESFPYDNDYLFIVLENTSGVFDQAFLEKVNALSVTLRNFPTIDQVINPIGFQHLVMGPMGVIPIPLIHLNDPERFKMDSARIYSHPLYSSFFAKDARSLMLQVIHQHIRDSDQSKALAEKIDRAVSEYQFDHSRIVGKLIAQDEFVTLIQQDFSVFLVSALMLSFALLLIIFRSLRIALLPYLISVTALVWLLGFTALLGHPITILGSLIPPVILFVSSSDAIHLINTYRHSTEPNPTLKLKLAVSKVFIPTLLTSATTAIGFFSLIFINTEPIQNLGIFAGTGVLMAFVITFLFAPLFIQKTSKRSKSRSIDQRKIALWVLRHPKLIISSTILLVILSIFGIAKLQTDAYLLKDLPSDSRVREDFAYTDTKYGGSKPWELAYWPKDPSLTIWNPDVMEEAGKIQNYLCQKYPMERVLSPVTFMKYGNQMINGGRNDAFSYPEHTSYRRAQQTANQLARRNELLKLISDDQNYARFAGYIPEYGSKETIARNKKLQKFLEENIDPEILSYRLTGTTYLIDKSHELLSANLFKGLGIATGVISLILGFYFRSFKVLIISLIPNIIPLLVTAGYMGYVGIPLKLTTSIIFAVAFGIAVDDTIHFISVYRRQKSENKTRNLLHTFQSAGNAIIITTVIIVAGFSLFIFSSFGATYYLGLFLSLSLVIALATDLTILPLLLHLSQKNKKIDLE